MAAERQDLISRTEERISALNDSIKIIECAKQDLKENVVEVKSKIHSVVSRQLESLRNREVWLLGQVDIIEESKDQILQAQQDKLHHALGSLTNSLEYSNVDSNVPKINVKLSKSLERLDGLELRPLETSHISFRADTGTLKSAIHNFGKVDSKGLNIDSAFFHRGDNVSPSLPQTFEDYGDAEHHVLYKTIEDIRKNQDDGVIHISIPKLSKPNAEWLTWTPETTPTPTPTYPVQFTFPQNKQPVSRTNSTHEWLAHIKQQTSVEEDEFEVLYPNRSHTVSESSSIELLNACQEEMDPPALLFPYFGVIKETPCQQWLKPGEATESCENQDEILAYFRETMENTQQWLATFKNQIDVAGPCSFEACGQETEAMVDIENLDKLCCMDYPLFSHVQKSSSKIWLLENECNSDASDEKDVDEAQVLYSVCRANEVCGSFSECLCDENCSSSSNSSSVKSTPKHSANSDNLKYFSHIPTDPVVWLTKPMSTATIEDICESPLFSYFKTIPKVYESWLLNKDADNTKTSNENFEFEEMFRAPRNADAWLSNTQDHEECHIADSSISNEFKTIIESPVSCWLKDHDNGEKKDTQDCCLPNKSEQWLAGPSCVDTLSSRLNTEEKCMELSPDSPLYKYLLPKLAQEASSYKMEKGTQEINKNTDKDEMEKNKMYSAKEILHEKEPDFSHDLFSKISKVRDLWLHTSQERNGPDGEDDESVWLQKKENCTEKVSNDTKDIFNFSELNFSNWLS